MTIILGVRPISPPFFSAPYAPFREAVKTARSISILTFDQHCLGLTLYVSGIHTMTQYIPDKWSSDRRDR